MAVVAMPRLSDSMEEGTILKWLKSDGDDVQRGEEIVEIETDKANMTYEADEAGALTIVAQEGDTLAVGATIAKIGAGGGDAPEEPAQEEDEAPAPDAEERDDAPPPDRSDVPTAEDSAPESEREEAPVATADQGEGDGNGRVKASPIARRMAQEADVEAAAQNGKAAQQEDAAVETEATARPTAPAPEDEAPTPPTSGDAGTGKGETTTEELSRLQQTIARRMAESKATAPDFVLTVEVDMGAAVEFRKQLKAAAGEDPAPSFNDFVVKASALALKEYPRANGAYRDGRFELYSRVNVGIAVAGQDALIVPTVFDADTKSLGQIARDARALAERVRGGKITPPELSSGTFTVSNLGMFGIDSFVAVINPPQAAILAVGAMRPTPVARDGEVAVRNIMRLTLACDHRILHDRRERLGDPLHDVAARVGDRLHRGWRRRHGRHGGSTAAAIAAAA